MRFSTLFALAACSGAPADTDVNGEPIAPRKVLVVGWDGAKPESVIVAATPNLDQLGAWGAISFAATTQLTHPTTSGPGWTSVLTGVAPDQHGVLFNGLYNNRDDTWLTFMKRAHDAGLRTGVAVVWPEIATDIIEQDASDENWLSGEEEVANWMVDKIEGDAFDVHFVHLDAPDHAGHASGYYVDNPDYIEAIEESDRRLGLLLDAVEAREGEEWLVAATTDHGANGTGHGTLDAENQTIWTAYGQPGGTGGWDLSNASHLDVHPTVLDFLGIDVDSRGVVGTSRVP